MTSLLSTVGTARVGLLAHQGGWDEVLLVGAPIVVIALLLAVAKRRVDAMPPKDPHDRA